MRHGVGSTRREGRSRLHWFDGAPLRSVLQQAPLDLGTVVTAVFDDTCGNLIQTVQMKET